MATAILFHSVFGLRPVELGAAEMMRAAGHDVVTPDLYGGVTADTIENGFRLKDDIGWDRICARAKSALADLPSSTVLVGLSMGAGVVASVWPRWSKTRGVLLLYALADISDGTSWNGLRVQLHVAECDTFVPDNKRLAWKAEAETAGMAAEIFVYPGAGHFYTDKSLVDYSASAASQTRDRVLRFLAEI
jgi:dienelactone hydrolase